MERAVLRPNQNLHKISYTTGKWLLLSIITFGIYHIYHEYVTSNQILEIQKNYELKQGPDTFPILCLLLCWFGMFLVTDIVHQEEINKIIVAIKMKASFPVK